MTSPLPFLERMRALLGSEFSAFEAALSGPRVNSLRVNTLNLEPEALMPLLSVDLRPVPWCPAGFYVSHTARVGRHPLHAAGAYYVQEASAMAVCQVCAAVRELPGLRVLDLCAAPGGKSTHLGQLMNNHGLLVCNEPVPARARILAENLERLGVRALVTQEDSARLASAWGAYFDVVLADAPCSGEGMFRKTPEAALEWSPDLPARCALRQADILDAAARLLRPGGSLVYSTCTFAPEENEAAVARFLERQPAFELLELESFAPGRPEWVRGGTEAPLERTRRLWPHRLEGEGHFVAALHKTDGAASSAEPTPTPALEKAVLGLWRGFAAEHGLEDRPVRFQGELQALHPQTPPLEGLKVIRAGVPLAELKKDRLEPHHALSHLLPAGLERPALELDPEDPRVGAYLRGESLEADAGPGGWILVRTAGLALGWGKRVGSTVKNHYPKGLRG